MPACSPYSVTWSAENGGQCLDCGAKARTCFEIRHVIPPKDREDYYAFGLGGQNTRLSVMVDAKGRRI